MLKVKGFYLAFFSIFKYLGYPGDGHAIVDGHVDIVFLDFQYTAKSAVGNQQSGSMGVFKVIQWNQGRESDNDEKKFFTLFLPVFKISFHNLSPFSLTRPLTNMQVDSAAFVFSLQLETTRFICTRCPLQYQKPCHRTENFG
jgi:hypothetical protein